MDHSPLYIVLHRDDHDLSIFRTPFKHYAEALDELIRSTHLSTDYRAPDYWGRTWEIRAVSAPVAPPGSFTQHAAESARRNVIEGAVAGHNWHPMPDKVYAANEGLYTYTPGECECREAFTSHSQWRRHLAEKILEAVTDPYPTNPFDVALVPTSEQVRRVADLERDQKVMREHLMNFAMKNPLPIPSIYRIGDDK